MSALADSRRRPLTRPPQALGGGARPVAGGTDLVVGARQGKAPLPGALVAIHRLEELRRIDSSEDGACGSARSSRTPSSSAIRRSASRLTALADASGDRRLARDASGRDDRRQPDERLAGDGDRRAAAVLRRAVTLRSRDRARASSRSTSCSPGPGHDDRGARTSCSRRSRVPLPAAGTGSCYVAARVPPPDGDRGRRRDGRGARSKAARVTDARVAITALAPDDPARRRGRGGARSAATAERRRRRGARAVAAASKPISDVRASADYRSAMAAVIGRRAIEVALARARGEQFPIPGQPGRSMEVCDEGRRDSDRQRHRRTRSRSSRTLSLLRAVRETRRADRRQGGLRRLRVRRLHDAARRPAGELVLVSRAAGRGPRDHDRRGACAAGRAQ